jgi:hypothetical protein
VTYVRVPVVGSGAGGVGGRGFGLTPTTGFAVNSSGFALTPTTGFAVNSSGFALTPTTGFALNNAGGFALTPSTNGFALMPSNGFALNNAGGFALTPTANGFGLAPNNAQGFGVFDQLFLSLAQSALQQFISSIGQGGGGGNTGGGNTGGNNPTLTQAITNNKQQLDRIEGKIDALDKKVSDIKAKTDTLKSSFLQPNRSGPLNAEADAVIQRNLADLRELAAAADARATRATKSDAEAVTVRSANR